MTKHTLRPAFSMITAIFMIVLMSTVAVFIMDLSGKMLQATTTQYRKEQAILYAKSYTEFAIMSLTAQNCIQTISADVDGTAAQVIQGQGYRVSVDIQYIGNDNGCANTLGGAVNTSFSQGNVVLIDTYVHYRNPNDDDAINSIAWSSNNPGITYHRRTLQKL